MRIAKRQPDYGMLLVLLVLIAALNALFVMTPFGSGAIKVGAHETHIKLYPIYVPHPLSPICDPGPCRFPSPLPALPLGGAARLISGTFSGEDFPSKAEQLHLQGTTTVALKINKSGRVVSCSATGPVSILNDATCPIIMQRFRYAPATNAKGQPIEETKTQRVKWVFPTDE